MLGQGQDAPELNLMAPVKEKRMPLYMLMTMMMMMMMMMTLRNELFKFTLMDETQTIIVCHSFFSAVQY